LKTKNAFQADWEDEKKSKKQLIATPKMVYLACFEDWKKRYHMCILSGEDYFKEDEIDLED